MKRMSIQCVMAISVLSINMGLPVWAGPFQDRQAEIPVEENAGSIQYGSFDKEVSLDYFDQAEQEAREQRFRDYVNRNAAIQEQLELEQQDEVQEKYNSEEYEQSVQDIVTEDTAQGIVIPEGLGELYTISCYGIPGFFILNSSYTDGRWKKVASGTKQELVHEAWIAAGAQFSDGIAVLTNRYLIACTTMFGEVGDMVTFYFEDGMGMPCIVADEKAQEYCAWDHNPANEWGHYDGRNIVEFEVDKDYFFKYGNPGSDKWHPEIRQRLKYAVNEGSIL